MDPLFSEPEDITVLHVEDDEAFLDLSETFLRQEFDNIRLHKATSPTEGIDTLSNERVDCIVSDYEMPSVNGLEFLKQVRERDQDVPFILFTGRGSEEIAAQAIEAGVDSYLRKEGSSENFAILAHRIETLVERLFENRRAEKLEQVYELLARTATDAFWLRDMTTGRTRYSDGISRFGYEPGVREDGFEWWVNRVHSDDREDARNLNSLQREGDPAGFEGTEGEPGDFSFDYRWRCSDGSYTPCRSRGVVRFEDDEPVEMVGAMVELDGSTESDG